MPPTIFSLLDTPAYGGAEEYLCSVLFHLATKKYHVVLATNNASVKKACIGKIEVIDLPYRLDAIGNWKGLLKYFLALPGALFWLRITLQKLRATNAKVVCLFPGFSDRLSFSPFVKRWGGTLIWLEYGPLEPTFARNHGFPKLLYAFGRPFPDKIVTISEWTKRSLVQMGKIPESEIEIIYPGVEIPFLKPKNQRKKQVIISTVARLATEKEIDVLLKAWAKMDRTNKKLQIIGDGPERKYLEELSKDLKISDSVKFLGFVSDGKKKRLLSESDLFIFPSAWKLEGFGMTAIEAMAAGIPVITTGFGPQIEIVENGKTGWYFTAHDDDDLAVVMGKALRSSQRGVMGARGKKMVQSKFLASQMCKKWEDLILTVS
ncbi:MAG: glycosyltransferase family 4 protein [Candidatus Woesebacteria bacterium]